MFLVLQFDPYWGEIQSDMGLQVLSYKSVEKRSTERFLKCSSLESFSSTTPVKNQKYCSISLLLSYQKEEGRTWCIITGFCLLYPLMDDSNQLSCKNFPGAAADSWEIIYITPSSLSTISRVIIISRHSQRYLKQTSRYLIIALTFSLVLSLPHPAFLASLPKKPRSSSIYNPDYLLSSYIMQALALHEVNRIHCFPVATLVKKTFNQRYLFFCVWFSP